MPRDVARYVAFLRGINVGGHRVRMDELRSLFEQLDVSEVATFIASGNVVFCSQSVDVAALERQIESRLERSLGYAVATFIRSFGELAAVAAFDPSGADGAGENGEADESVYVIFLRTPADDEMRNRLTDLRTETDRFLFGEREVYWLVRGKLSESPLFRTGLTKSIGPEPNTMRTVNTVRRLLTKFGSSDDAR